MHQISKSFAYALLPNRLVGRIQQSRLKKSLREFRRHEVTVTYSGTQLRLFIGDEMGQSWYASGSPLLPEIEVLKRHGLKPRASVFDLGAHQCVVALVLAEAVGPDGSIVAVEANPHNAEIAGVNKRLNGANQLRVIAAAVGEADGELGFNFRLNGSVLGANEQDMGFRVPSTRIDSLARLYGFPDVVLLDVEGFEEKALRGATEVIGRGATFLIEMHVGCGLEKFDGSVLGVAGFFSLATYDLLMLSDDRGTARPFDAHDPITSSRFYLVAVPQDR